MTGDVIRRAITARYNNNMAAKAGGLAKQIDAQLECVICQDRYKTPKVLPCLHSFCKECLDNHIKYTQSRSSRQGPVGRTPPPVVIVCPTCRSSSDLPPGGVDGYNTNFTLSSIVAVMDIHDVMPEEEESVVVKNVTRCQNGLDENPAVVHCLDCQCYLCHSCLELHKKVKATRNHKLVSLKEIKEDVRKLEQKRYCAEHEGEELKLYCRTCEEVICRDCTIVTHKQHDYTFIKDVRDELVKKMNDLVTKVRDKQNEFEGHRRHLDHVDKASNENIDYCKKRVNEFFDSWTKRMEEKKAQLLAELSADLGGTTKRICAENDAVELMSGQITSAIGFTTRLLEQGTPCDIAMMSRQTCKQLNHVQTLQWDPNCVRPCKGSFVGHDTNPLSANVRGGIHSDEIIVEGLTQPKLGENSFTIRVLGEIETQVVVVSIETANGERLDNAVVKENGHHEWTATYNIPRDGRYKISVSVDGVEAKGGPFDRVWQERLSKGTRVRRGQDWKWGDQDGGPLATGAVIGWATDVGASDNWVKIKWDNGRQNNYRWGAEGAFDLEIASP